ncbi:MAG: amidohydrolase family protein [Actinomycetota bacterium]|nr:amidohydrolase family protein [Actinomycetota bacterium]MDG2120264.1 amidohydrolase family protein [Actinomycetota bacterium]
MPSNLAGDTNAAWIAQIEETAIDPELPILDPHHHLWLDEGHTGWPYLLEDLHRDIGSGHNVVGTVYLECRAEYKQTGPERFKPVGETEFVAQIAEESASSGKPEIAAIIAHADLTLGDAVEEVLEAHEEAGRGRFRGIRFITAQDSHPPLSREQTILMNDPLYLEGVRKLGDLGYTYDAMVYHPQLFELAGVAKNCPGTPIVIDHLGCILGTGPYKDQRHIILEFWKEAMTELASCPNTFLKLGGIGMPMMGFRWDKQDNPATSSQLVEAWEDPIKEMIELFGPERCMFESNFPVDRRGAGYTVLWNAFKKIAANYSNVEKKWLFHDTAADAYRLPKIS